MASASGSPSVVESLITRALVLSSNDSNTLAVLLFEDAMFRTWRLP